MILGEFFTIIPKKFLNLKILLYHILIMKRVRKMNSSLIYNLIIKFSNKIFKAVLWNPLKKSQKYKRLYIKSAPKDILVLTPNNEVPEQYIVSTNDQFIGHNLYVKGHFDFEKFEQALQIIGKTFKPQLLIDIGANIGTICIPAIKRNIFPKAIAIEPEPFNFKLLRLNTILNSVDRQIDVYNVALSDIENEELEFGYSNDNYGDHRLRKNKKQDSDRDFIKIKTQTLEKFIDLNKIDSTLIWMDTQGFEAFILKGISSILQSHKPYLVIEFDPKHLIMTESYEIFESVIIQSKYTKFYDLDTQNEYKLNIENLRNMNKKYLDANLFTDLLFI